MNRWELIWKRADRSRTTTFERSLIKNEDGGSCRGKRGVFTFSDAHLEVLIKREFPNAAGKSGVFVGVICKRPPPRNWRQVEISQPYCGILRYPIFNEKSDF